MLALWSTFIRLYICQKGGKQCQSIAGNRGFADGKKVVDNKVAHCKMQSPSIVSNPQHVNQMVSIKHNSNIYLIL